MSGKVREAGNREGFPAGLPVQPVTSSGGYWYHFSTLKTGQKIV